MVSGGAKVVIAHDYATQRGGAERVALDLLRAFPGSRLVTSCWNPETTYPEFADHEVETLWINKFPSIRRDPRRAFPLLAKSFAQHRITDADVVICSSSGWSHRLTASAPKIVYCHNPARWLYQSHEYFPNMSTWTRRQFLARTRRLRETDAIAAHAAATYLVNSASVADRVRATYGIEPTVLPPARGLSPHGEYAPVPGLTPGYLLTISRARAYKQTDAIREAVASMPGERLVVVGGTAPAMPTRGVTHVSGLSDAQMRWLYANAAGLVAVAQEDFGLTPVEAQSFGIPTVALRRGGYLDSMIENVTGVFVDDVAVGDIVVGIRSLRSRTWDREALRRCGDRYAPEAFAARMHQVVQATLDRATSTDIEAPIDLRAYDHHEPRSDNSQFVDESESLIA